MAKLIPNTVWNVKVTFIRKSLKTSYFGPLPEMVIFTELTPRPIQSISRNVYLMCDVWYPLTLQLFSRMTHQVTQFMNHDGIYRSSPGKASGSAKKVIWLILSTSSSMDRHPCRLYCELFIFTQRAPLLVESLSYHVQLCKCLFVLPQMQAKCQSLCFKPKKRVFLKRKYVY